MPLGYSPTARSSSTKITSFQCPSDRDIQFQITPAYVGGALSGPVLTKGNYGASWGNTVLGPGHYNGRDPGMINPVTGTTPTVHESAFGFTHDRDQLH